MTAESVASLNLLESEAVAQKSLPLALNLASRPVALEGGAAPVEVGGADVGGAEAGAEVAVPGKHWE